MNSKEAEVLRRTARPFMGKQVWFGSNQIDKIPYRVFGIRLQLFHKDTKQPNPVIIDNIETESGKNLNIQEMIQDFVEGGFSISMEIILEP